MFHFKIFLLFAVVFSPIPSAASGFEDNFDDGDMAGWLFNGINPGPWSAASGEMQSASIQTEHMGGEEGCPGAALIGGIVTPDQYQFRRVNRSHYMG